MFLSTVLKMLLLRVRELNLMGCRNACFHHFVTLRLRQLCPCISLPLNFASFHEMKDGKFVHAQSQKS